MKAIKPYKKPAKPIATYVCPKLGVKVSVYPPKRFRNARATGATWRYALRGDAVVYAKTRA